MSFLHKILPDLNKREIKKYQKIVEKINAIDFSGYSDADLKNQTHILKEKIKQGNKAEDILPEAYATVKEASSRVLGMKHYDVQLIGGIALYKGSVAEMKTGEGKTLVGTLPTYLHALLDRSVHIVTVNDYLAKRDYEELSELYSYLGVSSGFIHSNMTHDEKKETYQSNVVFGTNNEFGFDFLRDNMAKSLEDRVQGDLDFAIIDEVDSILIDEARTPLIISGPSSQSSELLIGTNNLVKTLKKNTDFEVDEETQRCFLTEEGITKTEKFFSLENLFSPDNAQINHFLSQSLRAHSIMKKDKDYIVTDGEVHIVDPFTGRVSKGRRYSNSLHQAIEAKENVDMQKETVTKATVTFQNYFRLYKKLAGMTGTAKTEEEELYKVYGMNTVVVPTNKPIQRQDMPDLIFPTTNAKMKAVIMKINELHEKRQPILIGTSSIEESEQFSKALTNANISHVVLNAKNHEKEAEIVSDAGQMGVITIATNMAGRGTDIKLGDGVKELGGLYIIGTSRNENRRVDNQLRGRAGRQGDEGYSQFYVSLEDELMVRFGANKVQNMLSKLNLEEGEGLSSSFLTKVFENAQKQLEGSNYDSRKRLLEYDDVLRRQREIIYKERLQLLSENDLSPVINNLLFRYVKDITSKSLGENDVPENYDLDGLNSTFQQQTGLSIEKVAFDESNDVQSISSYYVDYFKKELDSKLNSVPDEIKLRMQRDILLYTLDLLWEKHLDSLNGIRQGIHLHAYSQQDPLREYEFRAMDAFDEMLNQFALNVSRQLLMVKIQHQKS